MNYPRLAMAAVGATIIYFVFGFLSEGLLIRKSFTPYTAVYRSADTVVGYFPLGIAGTLIATFVMAVVYAKGYEGRAGAAEGFRFGVLIGVFVVCAFVTANFVTLNIGRKLAIELAISAFVQWAILGIVIGLVYRPLRA
jgi:hypothetical protein